jgi:hypothetical protein
MTRHLSHLSDSRPHKQFSLFWLPIAKEAGPKHYKAPIFVEYKFRSIGFHAEGQYYVRYAEHICFYGTYIEGSNEEINACIQLYGVRHLVTNVFHASELENYADGQRIVDSMCELDGWFHEVMESFELFCSAEKIERGEQLPYGFQRDIHEREFAEDHMHSTWHIVAAELWRVGG